MPGGRINPLLPSSLSTRVSLLGEEKSPGPAARYLLLLLGRICRAAGCLPICVCESVGSAAMVELDVIPPPLLLAGPASGLNRKPAAAAAEWLGFGTLVFRYDGNTAMLVLPERETIPAMPPPAACGGDWPIIMPPGVLTRGS